MESEDNLSPSAEQAQYLPRAASPYGEGCLVHSNPVQCIRKGSRNMCRAPYSHSSVCVSRPPGKRFAVPRSHSIESFVTVRCQRCHGSHARACGGDLLERHSEYFTKSRKPFTPRTLISDAKPFLSEYRFYTPAQRKKKNHRKQCVEAQTQTDMIRYRDWNFIIKPWNLDIIITLSSSRQAVLLWLHLYKTRTIILMPY